jgi:hypothetical protein
VLIVFGITRLQIINLIILNKLKERQRVANGKPIKVHDLSMTKHFAQASPGGHHVEAGTSSGAGADLTDRENDEFQYIL